MKPAILIVAILSLGAAAYAQPAIATGGVLNGASFTKGQAVAPGSLVSIFGTNLATTTASASSVPLSTSLGGVSVTFNNIAAPLVFVSHSAANGDQINAQVPYELAGSSSAQVVVNDGTASAPQTVYLAAHAPGIFLIGSGQAVAYGNTDFAFAAATGSIPGVAAPSGQDSRSANAGDSGDGLGRGESAYCRRRRRSYDRSQHDRQPLS